MNEQDSCQDNMVHLNMDNNMETEQFDFVHRPCHDGWSMGEWTEDFKYCRLPSGIILDMDEVNVRMQEELDAAKDVPLPGM